MKPWRRIKKKDKERAAGGLLQLGHGDEAVETAIVGGLGDKTSAGFNWATAMKPWRHRPKAPSISAGERFNWATAMKPWRLLPNYGENWSNYLLQLGHGDEAVETRWRSTSSNSGWRFNWATAMKPWRLTMARDAKGMAQPLQLGHGDEVVETCDRPEPRAGRGGASIGPRR